MKFTKNDILCLRNNEFTELIFYTWNPQYKVYSPYRLFMLLF